MYKCRKTQDSKKKIDSGSNSGSSENISDSGSDSSNQKDMYILKQQLPLPRLSPHLQAPPLIKHKQPKRNHEN